MNFFTNLIAKNKTGVRKSVLVPQLRGSSDQNWANNEIEKSLRVIASRVEGLEEQLTMSGNSGVIAKPGENGIVSGRLVSIGTDGVAWLANNTDATKPCTHVVAGVLPGGRLSCYGLGHWPVQCIPFQNVTTYRPLWVSAIPGLGTDVEPTGAALVQRIGTRMSTIDGGSGLCFCVFKPEFYKTGTSNVEYLDDLADVNTSGKGSGDVLTWDGSGWVADTPSGGAYITKTGVAAETIALGQAVFVDVETETVFLATADSQWRPCVGIAMGSANADETLEYAVGGVVPVLMDASPTAADRTSAVYLSETAGKCSHAPVDVTDCSKTRQFLGFAETPIDGVTGLANVNLQIGEWIWV